jgi:hypothetical protein
MSHSQRWIARRTRKIESLFSSELSGGVFVTIAKTMLLESSYGCIIFNHTKLREEEKTRLLYNIEYKCEYAFVGALVGLLYTNSESATGDPRAPHVISCAKHLTASETVTVC